MHRRNPMRPVSTALARKFSAFAELDEDEYCWLDSLQGRSRAIRPGNDFVWEGDAQQRAYILLEGWSYTSKTLFDGGRQVISIDVPGDFIALNRVILRSCDFAATAITPIRICEVG